MTLNTSKSRVREDMLKFRGTIGEKVSVTIGGELQVLITTRISEVFKVGQFIS